MAFSNRAAREKESRLMESVVEDFIRLRPCGFEGLLWAFANFPFCPESPLERRSIFFKIAYGHFPSMLSLPQSMRILLAGQAPAWGPGLALGPPRHMDFGAHAALRIEVRNEQRQPEDRQGNLGPTGRELCLFRDCERQSYWLLTAFSPCGLAPGLLAFHIIQSGLL
jgi:hypothetical protein